MQMNDLEMSDLDVSLLTYSEFIEGLADKSTPQDQFGENSKNIHQQCQDEGNKGFVSFKKPYKECQCLLGKNKINSFCHHKSSCFNNVSSRLKPSKIMGSVNDEKNCGHSVKKRMTRIVNDQIKLGVHVRSSKRNEAAIVKDKLPRNPLNLDKNYLPSKNKLVTKEISSYQAEHGHNIGCISANKEELRILKNNREIRNKRVHFDELLFNKSNKKQCHQNVKELANLLYFQNDEIHNQNKKSSKPHELYNYYNEEEKRKSCENLLSLNTSNSLLGRGSDSSVIQVCREEQPKSMKNCETNACGYSQKNDKEEEGRQFINDVKKNYRSCAGLKGCDTSLIAANKNNKLVKSVNNVCVNGHGTVEIPTLNKSDTSDTFTIDQIYKAFQIGWVRSCGFLKDVIPCLKNGVKEEAIQFCCKTCTKNFSFYDVKNSFIEEELCCLCPNNCSNGSRQKIPAVLSFKFIVRDLSNNVSTYLLIGKEAESFFGCTVKDFWHCSNIRHSVRRAIRNLLRSYDRKILSEFCISTKNLFGSGPKYLVNVGKKSCAPPIERKKSW